MATSATPRPGASSDPTVVDSKHYTVEYEDQRVRVLRARYNPGEKSVMHGHPALVAVMITGGKMRFAFPDGTTQEITAKAGEIMNMPALEHNPENLGDQPMEVVLVEFKS